VSVMRASLHAAISEVADPVWKLPAVSQPNAAHDHANARGGDHKSRRQCARHRDLRVLHLHDFIREDLAAHLGIEFLLFVLGRRKLQQQQLRRRELGRRRREPRLLTAERRRVI